jgi:hypothetical protein
MKFVELSGKKFAALLTADELRTNNLTAAGVDDDTVVRVNEQGDVEVRRSDRWDLIGGLLGDYVERIKKQTGMEWVE